MAIQKKSLIGNLSATKKAIVATNVVSTPAVSGTKVLTAKPAGHKGWTTKAAHLKSSKSADSFRLFSAKK